jgi:hypothetical protein
VHIEPGYEVTTAEAMVMTVTQQRGHVIVMFVFMKVNTNKGSKDAADHTCTCCPYGFAP